MNLGDRVREVRKQLLDEHHSYYLAPKSHPHGVALLRMLTRHPCGHVRWVIDWQACQSCTMCLSDYHGMVVDKLLAEVEEKYGS